MTARFALHSRPASGKITPRPYGTQSRSAVEDREKMRQVLIQGRRVNNGSYYVHVGDLSWWMYYVEPGANPWQHVYLWDGARPGDDLRGWALLSPEWRTLDVFVHPALRGSLFAWHIYDWAEEQIAAIVRRQGQSEIRTMWVAARDDLLVGHLERRGFARSPEYMIQYRRGLEGAVPAPELPEGYYVRRMAGERELVSRAAASRAAFDSELLEDRYQARYLAFMQSPVYRPELDIVAITPDGQVASFCNGWLDFSNRVGLFEPVGTHPAYQRLGLGKAVLAEGMRRMMAYGMREVIVSAGHDNPAAQRLYQSAGFQPEQRLHTFDKRLADHPAGRSKSIR
ncbi:MAG: GNAT family N-acetyltransferase [Anaerolineales bacterium]